jgi:hypothetical protein
MLKALNHLPAQCSQTAECLKHWTTFLYSAVKRPKAVLFKVHKNEINGINYIKNRIK